MKKSRFMGQSFEFLPIEERVQQYRELADATFLKAQKFQDTAMKARYLDMAAGWHALAKALETGHFDPEMDQAAPDAPPEQQSDAN